MTVVVLQSSEEVNPNVRSENEACIQCMWMTQALVHDVSTDELSELKYSVLCRLISELVDGGVLAVATSAQALKGAVASEVRSQNWHRI
jgi:hypothetical protein